MRSHSGSRSGLLGSNALEVREVLSQATAARKHRDRLHLRDLKRRRLDSAEVGPIVTHPVRANALAGLPDVALDPRRSPSPGRSTVLGGMRWIRASSGSARVFALCE